MQTNQSLWIASFGLLFRTFRKNRHKPPAFSILELLVSISLLFVLALLTISALTIDDNLCNALDRLESTFYYLQQRAIASNQSHTLYINTQARVNQFFFKKNNKNIYVEIDKSVIVSISPDIKGSPGRPETIPTLACSFPKKENMFQIEFFKTGTISAGTIYLFDKNQKKQGALTCCVSQVSYIRKYLHKENKWVLATT